VVRSGLPLSRWSDTVAGTSVEIEAGPLAGVRGTLVEFKSQHRLIVSVTILQRNVAVEIDASTAKPISESAYPPGPMNLARRALGMASLAKNHRPPKSMTGTAIANPASLPTPDERRQLPGWSWNPRGICCDAVSGA